MCGCLTNVKGCVAVCTVSIHIWQLTMDYPPNFVFVRIVEFAGPSTTCRATYSWQSSCPISMVGFVALSNGTLSSVRWVHCAASRSRDTDWTGRSRLSTVRTPFRVNRSSPSPLMPMLMRWDSRNWCCVDSVHLITTGSCSPAAPSVFATVLSSSVTVEPSSNMAYMSRYHAGPLNQTGWTTKPTAQLG